METINRSKITEEIYREILDVETHHDHEIIKDEQGTIRWKSNEKVVKTVNKIDLNNLVMLLQQMGYGKNSEVYRKLYRDIGCSLFAYWEVFYWEANNEKADEYSPSAVAGV